MRVFLFGLFFLCGSLALANNQSGNQHSPDGHGESQAWFLITKESKSLRISYCVNAKSPSEKEEIEQLVEKSITEWDFFYILVLSTAQDSLHWSTPDGFKMRFLTTLHATCRGDEDLTVYYGVEDARVKSVKDSYDSPLGFAHLENYNEMTGDGRGFIWISDAPEVRMHPNHRKALMYHEMGHVFGNGHVEGTVMEEDIAGTITRAYKSGKPFDPKQRRSPQSKMQHLWINFERDLAGWTEIEFSYHSSITDVKNGSDLQKALTALTGEALTGNFEVGFQRLVSFPDETDKEWEPKGKGRLQICADKCARESKDYR
ncbi:MAG: hypothetical protein ACXVBE_04705, partial [Bdellovibrionota bacterium]